MIAVTRGSCKKQIDHYYQNLKLFEPIVKNYVSLQFALLLSPAFNFQSKNGNMYNFESLTGVVISSLELEDPGVMLYMPEKTVYSEMPEKKITEFELTDGDKNYLQIHMTDIKVKSLTERLEELENRSLTMSKIKTLVNNVWKGKLQL
ncbi:hypothetical protein HDU99_003141, partial [Rhizoclosmatium hyalinum]